jgi:hypothetical protein
LDFLQASWEQSIKNRFKNQRKTKRKSTEAATTCERTPPPKKTNKGLRETEETGETEETCNEHVTALKKEMAKPKNKNLTLIKELMEATFQTRRKRVLGSPTTRYSHLSNLMVFY